MKLLVVEGNPKRIWQAREEIGGVAYHRRFTNLLNYLGYSDIEIAFPVEGKQLPNSKQLQDFSGILLTGSSLNVYDDNHEVSNQLDFAAHCFSSGIPIYGSCWGLQIAIMVAGGKIGKGKKGREFGIAKDITLTQAGKESPFFQGKPAVFDAYCIHEDDTHELPENAEVLATNAHSDVQALTLTYGKSQFFGVQYHPEFIYDDVCFLANFMQQRLSEEEIFTSDKDKADYLATMRAHPTINDVDFHSLEIQRWLSQL